MFFLAILWFVYIFALNRYLAPTAGYPSNLFDYGSHISITHLISHGFLFPVQESLTANQHLISSSLPIYHGIILVHLFATALEKLGLPLPGVMMFLADFSLLLSMIVLFKIAKLSKDFAWPKLILCFLVLILTHILINYFGFLPQSFGISLGLLAIYFWQRQRLYLSLFFGLCSTLCYPDVGIWLVPAITYSLQKMKTPFRVGLFRLSIISSVILFMFLARRLITSGYIDYPVIPYFLFLIILVYLHYQKTPKLIPPMYFSYAATSLLLTAIPFSMGYFGLVYYSEKYLIWGIYLLLLVCLNHAGRWTYFLPALCFASLVFNMQHSQFLKLRSYFKPSVAYNNGIDQFIKRHSSDPECHSRLAVSSKSFASADSFAADTFMVAANSIFDTYDIYENSIKISGNEKLTVDEIKFGLVKNEFEYLENLSNKMNGPSCIFSYGKLETTSARLVDSAAGIFFYIKPTK